MIDRDKVDFDRIIENAKDIFHQVIAGTGCPPDDLLFDYIYGDLDSDQRNEVERHLNGCEACQIRTLKLEADRLDWDYRLSAQPDEALLEALGHPERPLQSTGMARLLGAAEAGISKIKEALITWASPIWEPQWAGVAVTAADIPEQSETFDIDEGQLNVVCRWEGRYQDDPAFIRLQWRADLAADTELWVRFIDPKTQEMLYEACLGQDANGQEDFTSNELGFDPASRRWAVSFLLLDADQ